MMKNTCHLIKSILISSPYCKNENISKKIADQFQLQLINTKELEKKQFESKAPDVTPLIYHELSKYCCRSWLLDGYPRNRQEAEHLWKEQKCQIALNLILPINFLIQNANRARYVHEPSGREYTTEFNPPLRPLRDNETGERLVRDADLTHDEVRDRILESESTLREVAEFYRETGVLQEIHGNTRADLLHKSRICLKTVLPDAIL